MKKNNKWYSVFIALLLVWFLLVLTSWVYRLVLNELNDNRGRGDYIKAYYAAESWIEWALLNIKDFGYAYFDEIKDGSNDRSIVLSENPLDKSYLNKNRDALISYLIDTKTSSYSGTLLSWEHVIIPLYYIDNKGRQYDSKNIQLSVSSSSDSIVWNIVGENFWISNIGEFNNMTNGNYKYIENDSLKFSEKKVGEFLSASLNNYLILFNSHPSESLNYTLLSTWDNFFTKPVGEIYASWRIGSYKQNIRVSLDNTAYLNILKYSIFSN